MLIRIILSFILVFVQNARIPGPGGASAGVSWTLIQHAQSSGSSTCVVSTSGNITSGNLIVISGLVGTGGSSTTVTDNHSNTWSTVDGDTQSKMFYLIAPSTQSMTATIAFNGSSGGSNCAIAEFSGNAASPLDANGHSTDFEGSGTVSVSTSSNLTTNSDLIVGWIFGDNSSISSVGSGFITIEDMPSFGNMEYKVLTSGSGSPGTASWTTSGTETNNKVVGAFKH